MIINEAFRQQDFSKAVSLVKSYLTKKIGKIYYYPTIEKVKIGGTVISGIRFYHSGGSFRINFLGNDSVTCSSISLWEPGSKYDQPTSVVEFDEKQSIVSILPFIVDLVKKNVGESGLYIAESENPIYSAVYAIDFNSKPLNEATYTSGELSKTVFNTISALKQGLAPAEQYKAGGNKKYGPRWNQAIDAIKELYPEIFEKQGVKYVIKNKNAIGKIDSDKILEKISGGAVGFKTSKGQKEIAIVPQAEGEQVERMTYEEQLDALKTGMKLLLSNATNAIFLSGRGGVGKTATVEEVLNASGKEDGDGYFKVTGSASPVGIYRLLFEHRTEIILFDDSDSALADQEGRNLFKAAADTKAKRKLNWMKGGKNFVDPDDYDEDSDDDTLPRSFEFTGKIIFISNLPLNKLDPDGALRTRAYVIDIDPSNEEIYAFMEKIVNKIPLDVDYTLDEKERKEVVEVLRTRKISDKTANLRSLVRALNTRAGVEQQGGTKEEWVRFIKLFA